MHLSFGAVVLQFGLFLMFAAQLALATHAFTGNPLQGLACFLVPLYIYVYARRHKVGTTLMRIWYAGVALWVAGAVMLS